jgi:5-oxoprolinase (ATP-hydrolysing) subunit C
MPGDSTRAIEVLDGGIATTVQDYPGRVGMMSQGLFPAGPMDHFAFRVADLLVGNEVGTAALEVTLGGLGLRFDGDAMVAVCGAETDVTIDGEPVPLWESRPVTSGTELRIGISQGPGFRQYVAVSGGVDVPLFFGSRSTYTMGARYRGATGSRSATPEMTAPPSGSRRRCVPRTRASGRSRPCAGRRPRRTT